MYCFKNAALHHLCTNSGAGKDLLMAKWQRTASCSKVPEVDPRGMLLDLLHSLRLITLLRWGILLSRLLPRLLYRRIPASVLGCSS